MKLSFMGLLFFTLIILLVVPTYSTILYPNTSQRVVVDRGVLVEVAPPWDTIDSGVAECVVDAVKYAESMNALLIMRVDSYGGYLDSAFSIGDSLYYSKTPTIAFVENKALSAGTLIILPADIIGLKRGSIIGAMKPVIVNPVTGEIQFVNESKILEPVIGKAKVYGERRGRNTSLIEDFVTQAKVVNSSEAVKYKVADYEVLSLDELIGLINGVQIEKNGVLYELSIKSIEPYSCSIRSRFLSLLSNSYLANILLSIGVLAAIFSLVSGKLVVLPLAIAFVLLGLMSSGLNPNMVSLFFILMGALLLALELFVIPGFGIVGISGIILLLLGFALIPMYIPTGVSPTGEYINAIRAFILGTALTLGSFFGVVLFKVVQVRRKKPVSYTPEGKSGVAVDEIKPGSIGFVKIEGEYWRATSSKLINPGDEVVVVKMRDDGILVVEKKESTGT